MSDRAILNELVARLKLNAVFHDGRMYEGCHQMASKLRGEADAIENLMVENAALRDALSNLVTAVTSQGQPGAPDLYEATTKADHAMAQIKGNTV